MKFTGPRTALTVRLIPLTTLEMREALLEPFIQLKSTLTGNRDPRNTVISKIPEYLESVQ